jgi:hypothetical protein
VSSSDDAALRLILERAAAAGLDPQRVAIALGLPPGVPPAHLRGALEAHGMPRSGPDRA